jgi:hypothetical protein
MFHIKGPILKVFEIISNCCHYSLWDILRSMALMLRANRLLAMAKDIGGLHFIVVGEVFF